MRLGSLCTGIGGLDLAAEAHFGAELVWCAEWETHLDPLIQRHFGPVLNLRDLTTVAWDELEPVDILTAGYPCQPFSHAGKRQGADDERHLWPHIAEAVRVLRPRWAVFENVAGHLSLGFGDVLRDLAEAGFDAEWCLLRASDVGAPHQRARLFIAAANAEHDGRHGGSQRRCASESQAQGWVLEPEGRSASRATADPGGERHGGGQDGRAVGRVDRGDAGAPRQRQRSWSVPGDRSGQVVPDADVRRCEQRDEGVRGIPVPDSVGPRDWGQYAAAIRRWETVLGRPAPRPVDHADRLSPAFVEWMMGYPAGWVDGLSRTQALKALGNAVVPQQGLAALRELCPVIEEQAA